MNSFDGPTIGKRVAKYRQMNGQSAEELAISSGAGFSRPVIANIETGRKKELSVSQLLGLAVGLGVSPAALLFDIDDPSGDSGIVDSAGDRIAVLHAVDWMSGHARLELLGPSRPAREHTQSILGLVRAYGDALGDREDNRANIARLSKIVEDHDINDPQFPWLAYLKQTLPSQDLRIREYHDRLMDLGVDIDFMGI